MIKRNAFTLIEMLVSLVVAAILILGVAAITNIGSSSYIKQRNEENIYNDLSYGFKLIQNRVHSAAGMGLVSASGSWIGDRLIVGNEVFGLYQTANTKDFVHLPDKADENIREIILSVPNTDTINLTLTQNGKEIIVRVDGKRAKTSFDMSITVSMRM